MKKSFKNSGFKKTLKLLLVSFILISFKNVYAKMLTIEEVNTEFNNSSVVEYLNQSGNNITSKIDSSTKLFNIYNNEEQIFSFKYTDSFISYEVLAKSRIAICDNESILNASYWTEGVIEAIIKASGFNNKDISLNADYTNTFDEYGLLYDKKDCSEEASSFNSYVNSFRMSFDTDKITALVGKYATSNLTPEAKLLLNAIPTLKAQDVTEKSVVLYPNVDLTDIKLKAYCHIYRAESENGEYKRITSKPMGCTSWAGYQDNDLEGSKDYFYKAVVILGDKEGKPSNIVKVTTEYDINSFLFPSNNVAKDTSVTQEKNESKTEEVGIENPKTGVNIPVVVIILMGILGVSILIYTKRHNVIRKL